MSALRAATMVGVGMLAWSAAARAGELARDPDMDADADADASFGERAAPDDNGHAPVTEAQANATSDRRSPSVIPLITAAVVGSVFAGAHAGLLGAAPPCFRWGGTAPIVPAAALFGDSVVADLRSAGGE